MGLSLSKPFEALPRSGGYVLWQTFHGHKEAINCLRFSPDGTLIASGADDNQVRIWSIRSGTCMQVLHSAINGPVTDILWFPSEGLYLHILFSCADGTVHVYRRSLEKGAQFRALIIIPAHKFAVEAMDFDPLRRRLATVGGGEVKVWNLNPDHAWSIHILFSIPSAGSIARSVHFAEGGKSLIATFLDSQEIMCWNIEPCRLEWRSQIPTPIGNAALSPDGQSILVDNFTGSVDAYAIPSMVRKATYQTPADRNRPKQIAFGISGDLVVHGSDRGLVYISDFLTADMFQTLPHSISPVALVQAVTTHCARGTHLIASGSSDDELTVKVWVKTKPSTADGTSEHFPWEGLLVCVIITLFFLIPRAGYLSHLPGYPIDSASTSAAS